MRPGTYATGELYGFCALLAMIGAGLNTRAPGCKLGRLQWRFRTLSFRERSKWTAIVAHSGTFPKMLATFLITRCEGTAYRFANFAQNLP
jgi:hypothetical protein